MMNHSDPPFLDWRRNQVLIDRRVVDDLGLDAIVALVLICNPLANRQHSRHLRQVSFAERVAVTAKEHAPDELVLEFSR